MTDYQHLYYALFNQLSNFIAMLESAQFDQSAIIQLLKDMQTEAEERFINDKTN